MQFRKVTKLFVIIVDEQLKWKGARSFQISRGRAHQRLWGPLKQFTQLWIDCEIDGWWDFWKSLEGGQETWQPAFCLQSTSHFRWRLEILDYSSCSSICRIRCDWGQNSGTGPSTWPAGCVQMRENRGPLWLYRRWWEALRYRFWAAWEKSLRPYKSQRLPRYASANTFKDHLQQQKIAGFPLEMVRSFAYQLFQSLAFLHGIGLTHTDLKVLLWTVGEIN